MWFGALGTVIYSQIHRYRHAPTAVQRQQIKWVAFGISVAFAGFLGIDVALSALDASPEPATPRSVLAYLIGYTLVSYLVMLLVPVTIGIAMLRHHLFDIDLVINRTLVYGTLTAGVVAIYVLLVGFLGTVVQIRGTSASRCGRWADRGGAVAAAQPVAAPSTIWSTASATSRMRWCRGWANAWNPRLRRMPCCRPSSVLWGGAEAALCRHRDRAGRVQRDGREHRRTGGRSGAAAAALRRRNCGQLVLAHRPGEQTFTAGERLLRDLARQIGVAAHAVRLSEEAIRLSADLQHSGSGW